MTGAVKYYEQVDDIIKIDESELDKAVAEIKKRTKRAAEEVYKLGGILRRIRDEELWALRIDPETGKGKYAGFWEFCEAEVVITESYVRRLMAINEQFSVGDVKKFGVTRLHVSMRLPEHKRKDFLKRSKYVSTVSPQFRELAKKVADEPARQYGDPNKTVPVDIPLGLQIEPMWVRPHATMAVGQPTKPATRLKDDPWAKFRLSQLVLAYVRLTRNDKGDIMAILEIRQGKETRSTAGEEDVR